MNYKMLYTLGMVLGTTSAFGQDLGDTKQQALTALNEINEYEPVEITVLDDRIVTWFEDVEHEGVFFLNEDDIVIRITDEFFANICPEEGCIEVVAEYVPWNYIGELKENQVRATKNVKLN